MIAPIRLATPEPSFRELFTPKLVTVFRESYQIGGPAGAFIVLVAATASLGRFAERAHRRGAQVFVTGATRSVRHVLLREGLRRPVVRFAPSVADARMAALHAGG